MIIMGPTHWGNDQNEFEEAISLVQAKKSPKRGQQCRKLKFPASYQVTAHCKISFNDRCSPVHDDAAQIHRANIKKENSRPNMIRQRAREREIS